MLDPLSNPNNPMALLSLAFPPGVSHRTHSGGGQNHVLMRTLCLPGFWSEPRECLFPCRGVTTPFITDAVHRTFEAALLRVRWHSISNLRTNIVCSRLAKRPLAATDKRALAPLLFSRNCLTVFLLLFQTLLDRFIHTQRACLATKTAIRIWALI